MKNLKKYLKSYPMFVLFVTAFIDMLGFGLVLPVFPKLVTPGTAESILPSGWSATQGFILIGWIIALFPLVQFITAPILGQISDRYGRKPVLVFSILGSVAGYSLLAIGIITKNIPLIIVARVLDGFTGGNTSVVQASVADISTDKQRASRYGILGVAFGLGFILGPFVGGKLTDSSNVCWFNATTPFWFAACLAIMNLIIIFLFLPETLKVKIIDRLDIKRPFHNIAVAFSRPGIRSIMPMNFLLASGFTFFTTYFGLVLLDKFGFSPSGIGNYFAYVGLWIALVQGGLTSFVSKKYKDYQVLRVSSFITGLSLLGYAFVPSGQFIWILLLTPFLALGYGLTSAFSTTIVSRITPTELQGEAMGINASVMALAGSVPAILSGYAATINSNLPTIIACLLMLFAGLSFWLLYKPGRDDQFGIR